MSEYNSVRTCSVTSQGDFRDCMASHQPFVFDFCWPAVGKWSPEYLSDIAGEESVPVSMAIDEQSRPTMKKHIPLKEYVEFIEDRQNNPVESRIGPVPYLKQFDFLSIRPQLRDDMDWSFLPNGRKEVAFWLGTSSSVTGLHTDPNNGVLAQIYGSKRIYLFAPDQRELLYPNSKYDPATRCCDADAANPDYRKHPRFLGATGSVAEISKGQSLFIPKGWYHQVVGLENNISVNCFFFSYFEFMTTDLISYRVPKWLHERGLYRRGNCVCHSNSL